MQNIWRHMCTCMCVKIISRQITIAEWRDKTKPHSLSGLQSRMEDFFLLIQCIDDRQYCSFILSICISSYLVNLHLFWDLSGCLPPECWLKKLVKFPACGSKMWACCWLRCFSLDTFRKSNAVVELVHKRYIYIIWK